MNKSLIRKAYTSHFQELQQLVKQLKITWAMTCDFQQSDILTSVDSAESVQSLYKLRVYKCCSVGCSTLIKYARTRRLIWGIAGCTYHIVWNRMSWLILYSFYYQVFYTSFFSADKDLYPDEIYCTDSLATTLVVSLWNIYNVYLNLKAQLQIKPSAEMFRN